MSKNAKSKDKGKDEEVPVHKEGEEGGQKGNESSEKENANVAQGNGQGGDGGLVKTEKEKLLDLYKQLKDLGINSIGDLEVKISRL